MLLRFVHTYYIYLYQGPHLCALRTFLREFSEDIVCVSAWVTSFVHLSAFFTLRPFTFTEKSDCNITFTPKINPVFSVINIIADDLGLW